MNIANLVKKINSFNMVFNGKVNLQFKENKEKMEEDQSPE